MKMPRSDIAAILAYVAHKYVIWTIILSYIGAARLPRFGLWIRGVDFWAFLAPYDKMTLTLPSLMLATLLFNAGLGVPLTQLRKTPRKAFLMLAGFFGNTAMPLAMIIAVSLTMKL